MWPKISPYYDYSDLTKKWPLRICKHNFLLLNNFPIIHPCVPALIDFDTQ